MRGNMENKWEFDKNYIGTPDRTDRRERVKIYCIFRFSTEKKLFS